MPNIGEVWKHTAFYTDVNTGEELPKYLLILGFDSSRDVVYKLLTSRSGTRSQNPSCYHGDPYPGYYMGILLPTGSLCKETWLDLRESENFDSYDFEALISSSTLSHVHTIPSDVLCPLLSCAAESSDVSRRQKDIIYASRSELSCAE